MASPQQNSKPPERGTLHDSKHAPGLLDPQMPWSQKLQNKHVSLMHNTIKEPTLHNNTPRPTNEWASILSHKMDFCVLTNHGPNREIHEMSAKYN
ncbi:hypothetical protein BDC45DRAFT_569046 [Circinella umbellata]|nr:hypothetical protein BDC45DRAFT_569046 [Circinella umbellata]